MEPKFNTSFIPKKSLASDNDLLSRGSPGFNIFNTLSTVIFVLAIVTLGGLYIYRYVLINQINQAGKDVDSARASFEVEKIQSLVDAHSRIVIAQNLLDKHVMVSNLLALLQDLTVKKMRFSTMAYADKTPELILTLDAEAQTYNALAEQSDIFSRSEFVKAQSISNFSLVDNGIVKAKFYLTLSPDLVSYKKNAELSPSN